MQPWRKIRWKHCFVFPVQLEITGCQGYRVVFFSEKARKLVTAVLTYVLHCLYFFLITVTDNVLEKSPNKSRRLSLGKVKKSLILVQSISWPSGYTVPNPLASHWQGLIAVKLLWSTPQCPSALLRPLRLMGFVPSRVQRSGRGAAIGSERTLCSHSESTAMTPLRDLMKWVHNSGLIEGVGNLSRTTKTCLTNVEDTQSIYT